MFTVQRDLFDNKRHNFISMRVGYPEEQKGSCKC